ncbi:MAG: FAD-dependent tricarballylate dehydrogenase TcuA [Alphaproteobacteria bacterium]|nr:FAD-dependent tricarballylate dehydrogenase TcuA [Alphaproteobacteria bacterium]
MPDYDVIVVGGGNAALCAALSAREKGASVVVLERAPKEEAGGNTAFTAGAIRTVYNGDDDILDLMPDLSPEERNSDFGSYTEEKFFDDMGTVTDYRADPDLTELLVTQSFPTLKWLQGKGMRYMPLFAKQAFKIDGRFKFWGGLTVEAYGGGPGLVEGLTEVCNREGIEIRYNARALSLIKDDDGVHGVTLRQDGKTAELSANAVVLACGGFEANAEMRTRYLGPGWELAPVRGTRFNTGDGIQMALAAGASPRGNWSGCHAVAWDRNAPEFGDLAVGDGFQKHSYPFGLIINAEGRRFVDEGADFRNYTYAKYGREILNQPRQFAYQVFDQKTVHLLRDEYRIREVTKAQSDTLEGLVAQMEGVDAAQFLRTVEEYNAAVQTDIEFNPTVKDGRCTKGLAVDKTNWANSLDEPPYMAFGVTCGITFTFGGVRIDTDANVIDTDGNGIPGLYAAGEMVGGLFYFNYPGGSGLMSGSVFGRIAGANAAKG